MSFRHFAVLASLTIATSAAAQTPSMLKPQTQFNTPVLQFDWPDVLIGTAEYAEGPTGTTVFYFPKGVAAVVDVRGGSPGTSSTDLLRLGFHSRFVEGIAFAGGSSYGLSAAAGAANAIRDKLQNAGDWGNIATVPGAIIFDLGARRFNAITPDEALGRAALNAAEPGKFYLGARGAGRFAQQGGYFNNRQYSGQGAAFRQVGPTKIAVFTVVNALGAVVDRAGNVVRCSNDVAERCGPIADYIRARKPIVRAAADPRNGETENTTITLLVTNQQLDFWALQRLAVQVHTSMARAIQPFHTQDDGDVLYAVSTNELANADLTPVDLGVVASEVAWDAVLSSVPPLPDYPRAVVAVPSTALDAYAGEYEFGPGYILTIRNDAGRLMATATSERAVYGFARNTAFALDATSTTHFIAQNPRLDRLEFTRDSRGRVTGVVLNPGHWGLSARRTK